MSNLAVRATALKPVPKEVYFNCTRSERKRVALELAEYRSIKAQAGEALTGLIQQHAELLRMQIDMGIVLPPETIATISTRLNDQVQLLVQFMPSLPPRRLLACHDCGYLIPKCTCVGLDGKPLDWALGAMA